MKKNKAPHDETYPEVDEFVTKINNIPSYTSDYQKIGDVERDGHLSTFYFPIRRYGDVIRSFIIESKSIERAQIFIDKILIYDYCGLYNCNEIKLLPLNFGIPTIALQYAHIELIIIAFAANCDLKIEYLNLEPSDFDKLLYGKLEFDDFVIRNGACHWKTHKKLKT